MLPVPYRNHLVCLQILMTRMLSTPPSYHLTDLKLFQINSEIARLRDLLPLPSSTRQRLSQLQLMALVLVYVRKSNYFDQGKHHIARGHLVSEQYLGIGLSFKATRRLQVLKFFKRS